MLLHRILSHRTRVQRALAVAHARVLGGAALVVLFLAACGDSSGPDGGSGAATLSGTIRATAGSAVLEGAEVTIGQRQATSDAGGHFEMTGLPVGPATVHAHRPGFLEATTSVTLTAGANTHDFALDAQQLFASGPHAMYLPAGVGPMRGAIIVLGGPVTSGFVTGGPIEPEDPVLEESLQALGQSLRSLAASSHVALFGTSTTALGNSAASDNTLFTAMSTFAELSGHPEIATGPVLLVGFSGGAPEAAGLVSRNSSRAIGLLVRVPVGVTDLTAPAALAVPTFVMQAALDITVNNTAVQQTFSANRSRGGLWSLGVEPGVDHHVASAKGNGALTDWVATALTLRLGAASGDPLIALDQVSGWLGNQSTLEIAAWASYSADRTQASWLLSESAATSWHALGTGGGPGGSPPRGDAKLPPLATDSRRHR